jgi:hypothetical protein
MAWYFSMSATCAVSHNSMFFGEHDLRDGAGRWLLHVRPPDYMMASWHGDSTGQPIE